MQRARIRQMKIKQIESKTVSSHEITKKKKAQSQHASRIASQGSQREVSRCGVSHTGIL